MPKAKVKAVDAYLDARYFEGAVTIGFFRGDGDFEILGTLSNRGENFEPDDFNTMTKMVVREMRASLQQDDIIAVHRDDVDSVLQIDSPDDVKESDFVVVEECGGHHVTHV